MPNTITTSGIVYLVPTLTDPGPDYATNVSNALITISTHHHTGTGDGYQINIAGQLVQNDLSLQGFNLSNTKSVEFLSQAAVLTGSQDVNCVYVNQNNLGFNNNDGIFVPITNGNTLAITTFPFTNWVPRSSVITANFSILYTDTYNLIEINSTGGPLTGTLPIANSIVPVAAGRLYLFRDVAGIAGTNNITIRVAVGSGNVFSTGATSITINNNNGYVGLFTDGNNTWYTWTQNMYNFDSISMLDGGLALRSSSQLLVDNTSSIYSVGGTLNQVGGLATFNGGASVLFDSNTQVNVRNSAKFTWQGTSLQEHQSGSADTYDTGSVITLNGTVNGTTTGGTLTFGSNVIFNNTTINNGTFSFPGTTLLNGSSIMSGTNNNLIGTWNVSGGIINGASSSQITFDKSCTISSLGPTIEGGRIATTVLLTGSTTYTCDSGGSQMDNYVGCVMANSSVYTVNLPASPATGRTITVGTVNDASTFTGFQVTVAGNGHNVITNGAAASSRVFFSSGVSGVANMTFTFINGAWVTVSSYNLT